MVSWHAAECEPCFSSQGRAKQPVRATAEFWNRTGCPIHLRQRSQNRSRSWLHELRVVKPVPSNRLIPVGSTLPNRGVRLSSRSGLRSEPGVQAVIVVLILILIPISQAWLDRIREDAPVTLLADGEAVGIELAGYEDAIADLEAVEVVQQEETSSGAAAALVILVSAAADGVGLEQDAFDPLHQGAATLEAIFDRAVVDAAVSLETDAEAAGVDLAGHEDTITGTEGTDERVQEEQAAAVIRLEQDALDALDERAASGKQATGNENDAEEWPTEKWFQNLFRQARDRARRGWARRRDDAMPLCIGEERERSPGPPQPVEARKGS